ncbi:MAG TPA: dicarboxylate/amino acid:cation symporter [Chthonomonadaceae bacterium]|nr:dicarboxylate/amino acid:cation symporter [Chthonomonadaceae bacterium]
MQEDTTYIRRPGRPTLPLYLRVLFGVALGAAFGLLFQQRPFLLGLKNDDLGQLGMLVIRLLKALAAPLVLFAILDALARTRITARQGGRLLLICLVNVSVAMCLGLTLLNTLRPGQQWRGHFSEIAGRVSAAPAANTLLTESHKGSLEFTKNIDQYIPKSLLDPFTENNIISIVLAGLLGGAALRRVKERQRQLGQDSILVVERFIAAVYEILIQMLEWVVQAVPFAVFGVVAKVVGQYGLGVFSVLWLFLAVMLLGLAIHSLLYYPMVAWLVGGKPPRVYLGQGSEAIITGLSTNSSLATVPVTLKCLTEKMRVSQASARLAACIGTNLNNDGITLYEAMAALFLAQATGFDLTISQQMIVVLSSLMAGAGVAGIPEAGLVMLPLVLGAAKLPEAAIAQWLPLILTVDWIIARCRSGVNVMSDMLVAILLDRIAPPTAEETVLAQEPERDEVSEAATAVVAGDLP